MNPHTNTYSCLTMNMNHNTATDEGRASIAAAPASYSPIAAPTLPFPEGDGGQGDGISDYVSFGVVVGLILMFLAGGCAVGPNYSRPSTAAPATWKETAVTP